MKHHQRIKWGCNSVISWPILVVLFCKEFFLVKAGIGSCSSCLQVVNASQNAGHPLTALWVARASVVDKHQGSFTGILRSIKNIKRSAQFS